MPNVGLMTRRDCWGEARVSAMTPARGGCWGCRSASPALGGTSPPGELGRLPGSDLATELQPRGKGKQIPMLLQHPNHQPGGTSAQAGAGFKLPLPSSGPPSGNTVAAAPEALWRDRYWHPALGATACLETPVCVGLLGTKITGPCLWQKLAARRQTRPLPGPGSLRGLPTRTPSPRCQEQLSEFPEGSPIARVFLLLLEGTQKLVPADCNFTHGWFSYASGHSLRFPITFSPSLFIPSIELNMVGIPHGSKLLSRLPPCHPLLQSHRLRFKALFLRVRSPRPWHPEVLPRPQPVTQRGSDLANGTLLSSRRET